ncbi:beta-ketoacyl-ACP reductase [Pseudooceanicola lipolyticus]|uniref:Beta-ketoacyl-ACP reductase n=1 Tax=Pseudooceanicola lipolyticus TaxID=2029104 RepID=A0A2M8J566_9RHOB|nr:SDR family NAD(P)-dependent oxidoreductase [Pseudooceanicola lipolyticus]PJE37924.1 beta-ketoacyl-ACP reductase [Pseudooceanicola lipolyticus]
MYRTIVVGSSGEIGLAVMRAAIARGDQAFGLDLSPTDIPGSAGTGQIDLRNDSSVQAGFAAAVKQLGGVDVVVNAAGLMARGSLLETSVAEFLRTIDTNLGGAFRLTQAAARIMQPQGGGAIIHISSIHALRGAPNRVAYAASKGGLSAFIHAVASELGPAGITINAVAPGPTGRGMGSAPQDRARALERTPLQRAADAEEVASAVLFLTSQAGRFITGHVLPIDGGASSTFFSASQHAGLDKMRPDSEGPGQAHNISVMEETNQ